MRAFDRDENIEVPKFPGAGQTVAQHREREVQHTTTVALRTRPSSVE